MGRAWLVAFMLVAGCKHRHREPVPSPPAPARTLAVPGRTAISRPARRPTLLSTAFTSSFAQSADTAWKSVGDDYERELASCEHDCREIAYDLVIARTRALREANVAPATDATQVPPPELQAAVSAIDDYVARLDAADDEVAPMKFTAAAALWRWNPDSALDRLRELLRDHRDDPTAEYAANELLHSLVAAERMDELRALVAELSADETFLANKPELRATLARLRELLAAQ